MSKPFNLAADINQVNNRTSHTAGQNPRKSGVSKEKQMAMGQQSAKMRTTLSSQTQNSLTRPSPIAQKKVNNVVKNIDAANSSKKPKMAAMAGRGGNFASLLTTNSSNSKPTQRQQQNKLMAQFANQGKAGKSSTRIYNQKQASKMVFSPQPPQQNTRVKFHKPALDLFRKSEISDMNSASPVNVNAFNQLVLSTKSAFGGPADAINFGAMGSQQKASKAALAGGNARGLYQVKSKKTNSSTRLGDEAQKSYSKKMPSAVRGTDTQQQMAPMQPGHYNGKQPNGMRFTKFGPNVKSQREFNNHEGQDGDNFSFVDKKAIVQNSFSPPPVPNGALVGEQRSIKQLLQGHGSEQRLQGLPSNSGQSSAARLDHVNIMQQNFFTPSEQAARPSNQRYGHPYNLPLNQAQSAKELNISGTLASQRDPQKDASGNSLGYGAAYDGYYPNDMAGNKGQSNGYKSSCEIGGPNGQSRRSPVKQSPLSKTSSNAQMEQQKNRTRIQKAPATANQLPSARLMSSEKQANNNIITQSVQIVANALSQVAQRDTRAQATRRGDLLKSGVNRRMEGIGYGSNPPFGTNNFEINNIKNYEDRMNINSLDGGETLAERQESFDEQYARQDNDDTEGEMNSDGEQTRRNNMMVQYQANYMRNTISRENHIASKIGFDYSKGNMPNVRATVGSDGFLSPASMTDQQPLQDFKRNKSAYKSTITNQQANGMKKGVHDGKNGSGAKQMGQNGQLNTNFSVLSFDNVMRMKNLGNFTNSQQVLVSANGGSSQQRLLSAHSSSQQNLNMMTAHRRDRSQRIHQRINKTNYNSEEMANGTEVNDTQVMSFRCGADAASNGREGPKTEQNVPSNRPQEMTSDEMNKEEAYDIDLYSKKLLSASVAQLGQANTHRQAGVSPSAVVIDKELGTQRAPVLVANESNMFKKKFAGNETQQKMYNQGANRLAPSNLAGAVPGQKQTPNFIKMNIKRAGLSREKYASKTAKDKNFDSTGAGMQGAPERALLSPKTYKEAPKNYGINSIGSIGSIGSPGSLSSQHLLASKKNLKKVRSKDVQNAHNLHGQTGTTGGTGALGTTGGTTTLSYRQLGNTLKTFRENNPAMQQKIGSPAAADRRGKNLATTSTTGGPSKSSLQFQSLSNLKKEILKTHRAIQLGIQNPFERNTTMNADSSREHTQNKTSTTKHSTMRTNQAQARAMNEFLTALPQTSSKGSQRQQMSPQRQRAATNAQNQSNNSNKPNPGTKSKAHKSAAQSHRLIGMPQQHVNSQTSISNQITVSDQLAGGQGSGTAQGLLPNLENNFTGGNSVTDGANIGNDGAGVLTNKSLSHSTSTSGVQKNRSRVKPQADCQFIQQMPNNDIDTVNILDFDAVHDLNDNNGNLHEAPNARGQLSNISAERSKDRKRAPQQPSNAAAAGQGGKPTGKRPTEKPKPTADAQQSPERKMNQLRQQLNQKGFQIELASSMGSLVPEKRGKVDTQIDTPDAELLSREAEARNQTKTNASGPANPKALQQANQRMQPEDYRNLQQSLEHLSNADQVAPISYPTSQRDRAQSPESPPQPGATPASMSRMKKRNPQELDDTTENERFSNNVNNSRYQNEVHQATSQRLNDSQMTTQTELQRYQAFSQHVTANGMIQSTIYHIRQYGQNIYDPEEKEKYYSDDFLVNQRHVNDKVEQELEEFKIEINEKVEQNATKTYQFLRPGGERIYMNTDSNVIDASHSNSVYHELPDYGNNRASNGNLMVLDDEEPFVGLAGNADAAHDNQLANAARKYDEMEAKHQRNRTDAAGSKQPANPSGNAYQQVRQTEKYMQFQREFTDQSMTSLLNNSRKNSSEANSKNRSHATQNRNPNQHADGGQYGVKGQSRKAPQHMQQNNHPGNQIRSPKNQPPPNAKKNRVPQHWGQGGMAGMAPRQQAIDDDSNDGYEQVFEKNQQQFFN